LNLPYGSRKIGKGRQLDVDASDFPTLHRRPAAERNEGVGKSAPSALPPSPRSATVSCANLQPPPPLRRWSGSALTPPSRQLTRQYVRNCPSSRQPNPYNPSTPDRLVIYQLRKLSNP
jgi:hypothetical protein